MMRSVKTTKGEYLPARPVRGRLVSLGAQSLVHLLGTTFVALTLGWLMVGTEHLRWIMAEHQRWGDWSLLQNELLIHFGIAASLWAMIALIGKALMTRPEGAKRVIQRARGTVITETLIVMPVLLLLIFGIAQLAVVNIAGMLLNYGTHQAARTVWLWAPEVNPLNGEPARRGVNSDRVAEAARVQAAAALTPVAPGDFKAKNPGGSATQFEMMRGLLLATQLANPSNNSGLEAMDAARGTSDFTTAKDLAFFRALDTATFPERSVRKFTFAYAALELEVINDATQAGVRVTYQHKMTFPMVGRIFGTSGNVAGSQGIYSEMVREAVFMAQVPPNAALPPR